jgi:Tfp pilus assembly PilM family ATPase
VLSARHKGWIGVDLGTSTVKLAQVERTGRTSSGEWSWRLAHARVIRRDAGGARREAGAESTPSGAGLPTTPNAAPGQETLAEHAVLDWWNQICGAQRLRDGFSGRRSACVLPAARVDLRAFNLPEGSEAERRAMIDNELEGLADEDAGRRVFDFWDILPPEQSKLENVNVLSLPEHEAVAVVGSLARAGLCCRVIDGLPLAIARAVAMANGSWCRVGHHPQDGRGGGRGTDDEGLHAGNRHAPPATRHPAPAVGALDWGAASATFSILWDGRPVFTRQFRDCGFAAMPAAVSQALGLSVGDAEQLLTTHGVWDPAQRDTRSGNPSTTDALRDVQEVITDVTSGLLNEIVSQLNKTLSYPELHRSGLVPVKIWLLGGGATVRNLAGLLSTKIQRSVETWYLPTAFEDGERETGGGGREMGEERCPSPVPRSSWPPVAMLGPAIALSALAFAV